MDNVIDILNAAVENGAIRGYSLDLFEDNGKRTWRVVPDPARGSLGRFLGALEGVDITQSQYDQLVRHLAARVRKEA